MRASPRRLWLVGLCGCLAWTGGLGAGRAAAGQAETLDRILAVVAGHVILQSDVRAFVELGLVGANNGAGAAAGDDVLTYLIERRLVLDEVERYVAADPPPDDVERRMTALAERYATEAEFEAALARAGFSADDLRQVLRDDMRREAYVENRFGAVPAPTEEQLRAYYDAHGGEFVEAGRRLPFREARPLVLLRIAEQRRAELVGEWVAGLVRRGQVSRLSAPAARP